MTVTLVTHPACLDHDTGPGHPESADRLRAVLGALDRDFPHMNRELAPLATVSQLCRVHQGDYVDEVLAIEVTAGERRALDADTIVSSGSVEAALRAAGGAVRAVDLVMADEARRVFVAVRPPGHHARPACAMGFCLFNSVAVAARHARDCWGLARIAVADFDVHHGNGTQEEFWSDAGLFLASSHQDPCYPGTGARHERGVAGNIANAPLPPGSASDDFRRVWRDDLLPALDRFAPELLIVSAGFDAHRRDPLAQLRLETDDFAWLTRELVKVAERHGQGRVISLLEGGYDLEALADSVAAHVRALQKAG